MFQVCRIPQEVCDAKTKDVNESPIFEKEKSDNRGQDYLSRCLSHQESLIMKSSILIAVFALYISTSANLQAAPCCCRKTCSERSSDTPKPLTKEEIAKLKERGGEVYEEYGEAWHSIRYQKEFTAAQWKTILLQKRVRVPLTADDQRALLELFVGE